MLIRALRAWSPWSPVEGLRWLAVVLVGLVAWGVAWWLAAREAHFGQQIRWAALASGGFLVVAYGDVVWLLRARWSIVQRRQGLLPDAPQVAQAAHPAQATHAVRAVDPARHGRLVVGGEGLDHFHRPDCPLAVGKGWAQSDRDTALAAGQRPCDICEP